MDVPLYRATATAPQLKQSSPAAQRMCGPSAAHYWIEDPQTVARSSYAPTPQKRATHDHSTDTAQMKVSGHMLTTL